MNKHLISIIIILQTLNCFSQENRLINVFKEVIIKYDNSLNINLKNQFSSRLYNDQNLQKKIISTHPSFKIRKESNVYFIQIDSLILKISKNDNDYLDGNTLLTNKTDTIINGNYINGKLIDYKNYDKGKLVYYKQLKDSLYLTSGNFDKTIKFEDNISNYTFNSDKLQLISNIKGELLKLSYFDLNNTLRTEINYQSNSSIWYNEKGIKIEKNTNRIRQPGHREDKKNYNYLYFTPGYFGLNKHRIKNFNIEYKSEKFNNSGKIVSMYIINKENIEGNKYSIEYFYDNPKILKQEIITTKKKIITRQYNLNNKLIYEYLDDNIIEYNIEEENKN